MKTEQFDMARYLEKIGVSQYISNIPTEQSMDLLNDVVSGHVKTFPYQNYDMFGSRDTVDLSADALFQRLVVDNRGGMCYETSELLHHVLNHLGFDVRRIPGFVLNNKPYDATMPESHSALVVKMHQKMILVEVGYCSMSIRYPIEFSFETTEEKTTEVDGDTYQLFCDQSYYQVNVWSKSKRSWFALYRFDRPLRFVDFQETNDMYRRLINHPAIVPARDTFISIGMTTESNRFHLAYTYNKENNKAVFLLHEFNMTGETTDTLLNWSEFYEKIKSIVNLDTHHKFVH